MNSPRQHAAEVRCVRTALGLAIAITLAIVVLGCNGCHPKPLSTRSATGNDFERIGVRAGSIYTSASALDSHTFPTGHPHVDLIKDNSLRIIADAATGRKNHQHDLDVTDWYKTDSEKAWRSFEEEKDHWFGYKARREIAWITGAFALATVGTVLAFIFLPGGGVLAFLVRNLPMTDLLLGVRDRIGPNSKKKRPAGAKAG